MQAGGKKRVCGARLGPQSELEMALMQRKAETLKVRDRLQMTTSPHLQNYTYMESYSGVYVMLEIKLKLSFWLDVKLDINF